MEDTRNGIEEVALLIYPFCTFRNFIFPSSFSFFFFIYVICYVYYSGQVTRRHEEIIK